MSEPVAELTSGTGGALPLGAYSRPKGGGGWRDWVTTVDHKKIGILYGATALFFFGIGGFEALLIRLSWPPRTARSSAPTSTTRSTRCTASPWSSW